MGSPEVLNTAHIPERAPNDAEIIAKSSVPKDNFARVMRAVCSTFGVDGKKVLSSSRANGATYVRFVAAYMLRTRSNPMLSLHFIGHRLRLDHTSVHSAVKRTEKIFLKQNPAVPKLQKFYSSKDPEVRQREIRKFRQLTRIALQRLDRKKPIPKELKVPPFREQNINGRPFLNNTPR